MTKSVSSMEHDTQKNTTSIKKMEKKLSCVEQRNKALETENNNLKEKLLDIEYRQKRNNLLFEGLPDREGETDVQCVNAVRKLLKSIPGLDQSFVIDKCHRIDGQFRPSKTRRVLCTFNWYVDVQIILRNRKHLPNGIYVNEDFPEEWVDRRKVLMPIFHAAKRNETLKYKTFLQRDKLVIDGHTFTTNNIEDVNRVLDVKSTCERSDENKILFLGSHSPYSNLHPVNFQVNNVQYNCSEQFIQSEKAKLFDDDVAQSRIMGEKNPYKIKKLGKKICNFKPDQWKKSAKQVVFRANLAKFSQNQTLRTLLLSCSKQIVKCSTDEFWGVGLHLPDRNALNKQYWPNKEGGIMSDILSQVRQELKKC